MAISKKFRKLVTPPAFATVSKELEDALLGSDESARPNELISQPEQSQRCKQKDPLSASLEKLEFMQGRLSKFESKSSEDIYALPEEPSLQSRNAVSDTREGLQFSGIDRHKLTKCTRSPSSGRK